VDTIPITKSTTDVRTVKKMFDVAKNGGALGLFPEGNKSFAGSMSAVKPSVAKLLKKLEIPVVIYTIEGGYFTTPRWSKVKRKGFTEGKIRCIIEPEELEKLSNEELYQKVIRNLTIDAYTVQANRKIEFVGKDLTSGIENLLYMCPKCGSMSTVYGEYNHIKCHNCDLLAEMDNYGYISGAPFNTLTEWDAWQKSELYRKNLKENTTTPILSDSGFMIKQKETSYKNKKLGKFGLELYHDRFVFTPEDNKNLEQIVLPLDSVAGYAIEGANGMQLWTKDNVIYRLKNDKNVSGLKYVNCMCALQNQEMHF
jgi:hypothetical protein